MAANDLTFLSAPQFPQVFEDAINFELRRVSALVDSVMAKHQLTRCYFSDEYCDCKEVATVHHRESELEFCERHFSLVNRQAVSRG